MTHVSYAFAALLCVGVAACQKSAVTPATAEQGIVGEWHWVSSMGGITGNQTYTPASTGTTNTWVFKADSTYQHYSTKSGSAPLTETGTFSLGSVKSIHSGQPAQALILRGKQTQTFVIMELTTRLSLSDNNYDGFGSVYER